MLLYGFAEIYWCIWLLYHILLLANRNGDGDGNNGELSKVSAEPLRQ
jgi:hypothetical protein